MDTVENKSYGKPVLWIVIPCYNEEEVLPLTAPMFLHELGSLISSGRISPSSRILFVNDGSRDRTWEIICRLSKDSKYYSGISLSRNFGHQSALLAGLMEAKQHCDITISIDCDGQDDLSAMDQMVDEYLSGAEIVYGVRSDRSSDTFFKRFTAEAFYKLLRAFGAEVVFNHADYRLVSARVLDEFEGYAETNIFLRGMFPLVGFKSASVFYERHERIAGSSHYPLRKMLHLAFDGITSLSIKPIMIVLSIGLIVSLIGIAGIIWAVIRTVTGHTVPGWGSLVCIICFLGGIQILSIGIIGEYIGKIYLETKRRPKFTVSEKTWSRYKREYKEQVQ